MAIIDWLTIGLSAKSDAFTTGIKKARSELRAYEAHVASVKEFKIAGGDTLNAFKTTLAVARNEVRRFARSTDVQVAIEIGREALSESWIKARNTLQVLVNRTRIKAGIEIAGDKLGNAVTSLRSRIQRELNRTGIPAAISITTTAALTKMAAFRKSIQDVRREATKQFTVRVALARIGIAERLKELQQFKTIRIGFAVAKVPIAAIQKIGLVVTSPLTKRIVISAFNATKLPAQAALATLGPLRRLAVAGVRVGLTATSVGLVSGIAGARSALQSFGRIVTSTRALLGGLFAIAGVGLGVGFFVHWIKGAGEALDATAKLSDSLGIQTEKLIGLQHAANLANVGQETLTAGLTKMLNVIGGATAGAEADIKALKQLGLTAQDLKGKTPDEALGVFADRLSAIADPAARVQKAIDIFGKGTAVQLLPLLTQGSAGLSKMQAEAERLGLTFSRLDAAKVEAANDALTVVSEVIQSLGQRFAVELAPFVTAAASALMDWASEGINAGELVTNAVAFTVQGIARLADFIELLKAGFHGLRGVAGLALLGIVGPLNLVIQGIDWLVNKITGSSTAFAGFAQALEDSLFAETQAAFAAAGESFDKFESGINSTKATAFFDDIKDRAQKSAAAITANAAAIKGIGANAEVSAGRLQKIGDTLEELETSLATFGQSASQKKLFDIDQQRTELTQNLKVELDPGSLNAVKTSLAGFEKQFAKFGIEMEPSIPEQRITALQQVLRSVQGQTLDIADPDNIKQIDEVLSLLAKNREVAVTLNDTQALASIDSLKQRIEAARGSHLPFAFDAADVGAVNATLDGLQQHLGKIGTETAPGIQKIRDLLDSLKGKTIDIADPAQLATVDQTLAELEKQRKIALFLDDKPALTSIDAMRAALGSLKTNKGALDDLDKSREVAKTLDALEQIQNIKTDNALDDFAAKMEGLNDLLRAGKIDQNVFERLAEDARKVKLDTLTEDAKRLTEELKTPAEKIQEQLEKMKSLKDLGLISDETFRRGLDKAQAELDKEGGSAADGDQSAETLERRFSFAIPSAFRRQADPNQEVAKNTSKGNAIAQDSRRVLDEINDKFAGVVEI